KKGTNHHLPPDRRNIITGSPPHRRLERSAAIIVWSGAPPSSPGAERRHLIDSDLPLSVPMHAAADPSRVEVAVSYTRRHRSPSSIAVAVLPRRCAIVRLGSPPWLPEK
ncbi:hypothetical protein LINPERHAP1_LOCUS8110, partial [Linum perenne]